MQSMTGYGSGSASVSGGRVVIVIRALNHRYQDVRVRATGPLSAYAFFVEGLVRERLGRGRYDVALRLEVSQAARTEGSVERIRALYTSLSRLRDEVAPGAPLDFGLVVEAAKAAEDETDLGPDLEQALGTAFEGARRELGAMRAAEGEALRRDISARIVRLGELRSALAASAHELVAYQQERLRERVQKLVSDTGLDLSRDRIEHEIALLADKSDVTEELVRLGSHLEQLGGLAGGGEGIGRKLDFLLQEVGREVNTIAAKCAHAPLGHLVVEAKTEVERLREQAQNVD